jgi:putative DNA primase/helicase
VSATMAHDFQGTATAALVALANVLSHWLPAGKYHGHEYQAINPTRADSRAGSFSINTSTGQWATWTVLHRVKPKAD